MTIEKGNKVKVEYEGRFPKGEVFDSTAMHGGEPIEFVVGSGMLVSGFEAAVLGMKEGEEKEVTLESKDAYGDINPEYVQRVPKDKFPAGAKEGMMIGVPTPMGQIPAKIVKIEEDTVELDMNHPMAGKTLVFKIKVVSFEKGDFLAEMKSNECECGDSEGKNCSDKKEGSCCKDEKTEDSACTCH